MKGFSLLVYPTSNFARALGRRLITFLFAIFAITMGTPAILASPREGGEAVLKLPDFSGQIHHAPVGVYRDNRGGLLWSAAPGTGSLDSDHAADDSALQSGRHRRQLWRGLVRNSGQHVREFAYGVRQPGRQALSDLCDSAESRHEHRHAPD